MVQDSALLVGGSADSFVFNRQVQLALQRSEDLASEVCSPEVSARLEYMNFLPVYLPRCSLASDSVGRHTSVARMTPMDVCKPCSYDARWVPSYNLVLRDWFSAAITQACLETQDYFT